VSRYGLFFFDALEEVFDMVTSFIVTLVEGRWRFAVGFWRDASFESPLFEGKPEFVAVVRLVL
jgi:hypothetical protein